MLMRGRIFDYTALIFRDVGFWSFAVFWKMAEITLRSVSRLVVLSGISHLLNMTVHLGLYSEIINIWKIEI